jgi:hypothetical protein
VSGSVLKPGSTVELTPASVSYLPTRTYKLRVPTVLEAVEFEERVETDGARQRFPLDVARTFNSEMRKLVQASGDPEADAALLAEIAAWVQRLEDAAREVGKSNTPETAAKFFEVARLPEDFLPYEQELHEHSRTWRKLQAAQRTYRRRRGITACHSCLVGWTGDGEDDLPPFDRDDDEVPDELLRYVHPEHLEAIADKVDELIRPTAARLKNLPSASSSTSSETPSTPTSPKKRRPNGHSGETVGSSPGQDGRNSESIPATS